MREALEQAAVYDFAQIGTADPLGQLELHKIVNGMYLQRMVLLGDLSAGPGLGVERSICREMAEHSAAEYLRNEPPDLARTLLQIAFADCLNSIGDVKGEIARIDFVA